MAFRINNQKTVIVTANPPAIPAGQDSQVLTNVNGTNIYSYPEYYLQGDEFIANNNIDASSIVNFPLSPTLKYIGSVLAPNGLIYSFPSRESNVLITNPYNNTYNNTSIKDISFSVYPVIGNQLNDKWSGGVVNGNFIYGMPQAAKAIMKINWTDNSLSFIEISSNIATSTYNWFGAVLGTNNNIYGIPHQSTSVLRLNPQNDSISTINISGGLNGTYYYAGGVLAPNGNIYGIPHDSSACLVIDTTNNIARTDISGLGNIAGSNGKYVGGVLGQDGKVYGMPFTNSNVLVIDPSSNTISTIPLPAGIAAGTRYYGGVLAPDGKIYCIPHRGTTCLVIDTTRNPAILSVIQGVKPVGSDDWWAGGVLAPNGKIYMNPGRSNNMAILKTSLPVYPNWMIARQFNKL